MVNESCHVRRILIPYGIVAHHLSSWCCHSYFARFPDSTFPVAALRCGSSSTCSNLTHTACWASCESAFFGRIMSGRRLSPTPDHIIVTTTRVRSSIRKEVSVGRKRWWMGCSTTTCNSKEVSVGRKRWWMGCSTTTCSRPRVRNSIRKEASVGRKRWWTGCSNTERRHGLAGDGSDWEVTGRRRERRERRRWM